MRRKDLFIFLINIFIGMQSTKFIMDTYFPETKCLMTVTSVTKYLSGVEEIPTLQRKPFLEQPKDFQFNPGPRKKLILLGILTASRYLQTRDWAIQMTWLKSIPGDVIFFMGNSTDPVPVGLPVVRLNQVSDNTYPPRHKMFKMLKYMYEHFADKYEYFIRGDDDLFIKGQELGSLLRSLNSEEKIYMGQYGQGVQNDKGKLGLGKDYHYCMGGPGVILSHKTLKMLAPHLNMCLLFPVTHHDDTELGRCIEKYLNIECKSNPKVRTLFYHNYRDIKGTFSHELGPEENYAITLHPVKNSSFVVRMAIHFKQEEIKWLKKKTDMLRNNLEMTKRSLIANQLEHRSMHTFEYLHKIELLNQKSQWEKPIRFWFDANDEVGNWENIEENFIYSMENMHGSPNQHLYMKKEDQVLQNAVTTLFNRYLEGTDNIKLKKFLRAYRYISPVRGVQHLLQVYLLQQKNRNYNATFVASQHLLPLIFTEEEDMFEERSHINSRYNNTNGRGQLKQINLIIPIAKKVNAFARFAKALENIFKRKLENLNVILVVYKDSNRFYLKHIDMMKRLESQYASMKLEVKFITGQFARAIALQHGTKNCSNDSLLVFIDIDMIITETFLNRVRLNTIYGKQVYFPVVFTHYNPETICYKPNCRTNHFQFDQNSGFWIFFGFGMVSIYKKDFLDVGGYDTKITTWGGEDVDFYDKCIKYNLKIFRAPDLAMIHIYHSSNCPQLNEKHYRTCIGSKNAKYGSLHNEAAAVYKFPEILNYKRNKLIN